MSASVHPLHAAAVVHAPQAHVSTVHPTAHTASTPSVPNPVLVNLTPQSTTIKLTDATYDKRVDVITITGTVDVSALPITPPYYYYPTPSYPTFVYINASATQAVNRIQSVVGYQSTNVTIADTSVKTIKFTEKLVASAGEFAGGNATISLTVSSNYYYSYNSLSAVVHLRNAKAY